MVQTIQSSKSESFPLVTVGIPTFNRPDGLRRTLDCICNQAYTNLEIIVSDNCSTDPAVKASLDSYALDSRVRIVIQKENIGAFNNFKFLLREATGQYFMWAADDDEWSPEFIEKGLATINGHSGFFSGMNIHYRKSRGMIACPSKPLGEGTYTQSLNFIQNFNSSMFYSIHRLEDIIWFAEENVMPFDWSDSYVVLTNILNRSGYAYLHDESLYTLGVDDDEYVFKPTNPKNGRMFEYRPFFVYCLRQIIRSKQVTLRQKISLSVSLSISLIKLFEVYEKQRKHYLRLIPFMRMYCRLIHLISRCKSRIGALKSRLVPL